MQEFFEMFENLFINNTLLNPKLSQEVFKNDI